MMKAIIKHSSRERHMDGIMAYTCYRVEVLAVVLKYYLRWRQTVECCEEERSKSESDFYRGAITGIRHIASSLCHLNIDIIHGCMRDTFSFYEGRTLLYKETLEYEFVEGDMDDGEDGEDDDEEEEDDD